MSLTAALFIVVGLFFFTGGSIGILRFPDFFSRLHPAGKLDTMGLLMSMAGMAIYTLQDFSLSAVLTSLKIMLIVILVFITSPTATHAILDAGVRAGLGPWTAPEKEERK